MYEEIIAMLTEKLKESINNNVIIDDNILINEQPIMKEITLDSEVNKIGINSKEFIEVIVAIEEKYEIEFDLEMLSIEKYADVRTLVTYVKKQVEEKKNESN